MSRQPISITLDLQFLVELDKKRGFVSRSRYIEETVKKSWEGDKHNKEKT